MIKNYLLCVMMLMASMTVFAENECSTSADDDEWDTGNLNLYIRGGYSIGGTLPAGFPAEMRGINSYSPKFNFSIGMDVERRFNDKWGLQLGYYVERRGFKADVKIRQYDVILEQGGETITGPYTGNVVINVIQTGLRLPFQVTWKPSDKWKLKAGPYVSLILDRSFYGYAYNGYLRRGEVRGDLVNVGDDESTRGYFSGDLFDEGLETFQWGANIGCDYYFAQHWGVYGDLSYGFNSAFKKSFDTVKMGLHPLYFTLGLTYKLGK